MVRADGFFLVEDLTLWSHISGFPAEGDSQLDAPSTLGGGRDAGGVGILGGDGGDWIGDSGEEECEDDRE